MRRRVNWRGGLPVRLFAAVVVVAAFAVAATAYLAVHTTRDVIEQEQDRAVASNEQVYSTLIAYAASHRSWTDAEPVLAELARSTRLRITLVSAGIRLDTAGGGRPPAQAATTLDALNVNPSLSHAGDAENIDRAVVGPFRIPTDIRPTLDELAQGSSTCFAKFDVSTRTVETPSGRPYLRVPATDRRTLDFCLDRRTDLLLPNESAALGQLQTTFGQCLPANRRGSFKLVYQVSRLAAPTLAVAGAPGHWTVDQNIPAPAGDCLVLARHRQLAPYVAPAARLYLTDETGTRLSITSVPHVSPTRVGFAAAVVLGLAAVVAAAGALWLRRSLRPVTDAAQRMRRGDTSARVRISDRRARRRRPDDLTELAVAFNGMAVAVEDGERQQKDLIADISHELRSPLTSITGWVEALQDGIVEPDPKTLDTIAAQTRQLAHVVDDLRDLALADAGQLNLRPVPLPVADLVEQVRAAFEVWAVDAGVELTTSVAEPAVLDADPARLAQCLGNLVSNALTYTPAGGHVCITARQADGVVIVEVVDDGIGIGPDELPHVFDRLWRAERSRSRRAGGSGLGLPIARRIARAHGGDVTSASRDGHGSTFSLTLPAGPPAARQKSDWIGKGS